MGASSPQKGLGEWAWGWRRRSEEMGGQGRWHAGPPSEPLPSSYTAIALGPKLILPPRLVAWGGLKSEFLKQSTARGFRTQDQPAGSKGRKVAAKGWVCMWVCAVVILM